uniref:Global nitrogen transcriptional regulator n=1 Tax=Sebdenia flabellata TaxID=42024 RepID=A0A1C9CA28_9FLOR|nr:global nitrogen transcriptional regulator [Sebdenia flabellata]AOM65242.1 global nitrogen transcriptional regulator [Sebdenia flabellata]
MQWIYNFTTYKIPFYIYKLKKNDCIIYPANYSKNKSVIILNGILYLLKTFTNGETISLAILNTNNIINIIDNHIEPRHYYYRAIALEETYIISFQWDNIYINNNIKPQIIKNIINSYQKTIYKYEIMNHIITHKEIKNRVIQLILYLCEEFGIIKKKHIFIPFEISQVTLSTITGSNKVTINKIMKTLNQKMLIQYTLNKKIYLYSIFKLDPNI